MTRLIEILISLAIVAVLFVAVGVVLPSSRHLSHSVETNRKLTIVYDTLNSLRRFKDWNPLVLRDPAVQLKLVGPESGKGARLEYVSKEEALGQGSWEIVDTVPGKSVKYAIESAEPGNNKRTEFTLSKTGKGGRNVQINQTYDVDYGRNPIGRLAGLYVRSHVRGGRNLGLSPLTTLPAAVPPFDYADLSKEDPTRAPKLAERPGENLLVVTSAVARDNAKVQAQMQGNMEWIKKVIAANGLEAAGPMRIITNEFGAETYSFDVAVPVRKAGAADPAAKLEGIKLEGPVTVAYSEPGKVAVLPFKGHMANLAKMRDALRGWAVTRGYETIERPYEIWKGDIATGFSDQGEFEVYWAVK